MNIIEKNIEIDLPQGVSFILGTINDNGYKAYVVGGCVRDSLLNRKPKDWDITTNAKPEKIIEIFENLGYKTIPTGIKHGTVSVVLPGEEIYEITTFRQDGKYSDARHPDNVEFAKKLSDDLMRRDFTINAIAYSSTEGLVDLFDGISDLNNKIIRAVGNPEVRFIEDHLRMMRAIRFKAQLGFSIESKTYAAICRNSYKLERISQERIRDEFDKILLNNPDEIFALWETGLLKVFLAEFDATMNCTQNHPRHNNNVFWHTMRGLEFLKNNGITDIKLYLSILLHDIGKVSTKTIDSNGITYFYGHEKVSADMAEVILRRMKYDNETIDNVKKLVLNHMIHISPDKKRIRKLLSLFGEDMLTDLFMVRLADTYGQAGDAYEKSRKLVADCVQTMYEVIDEKQPVKINHLAINGDDLKKIGIKPGKIMGYILNNLMELVLSMPIMNKKFILLLVAKIIYLKNRNKNEFRQNK